MTAEEYATRKLEECFSEEELRREKDRMDEHYVSSCMFAAEDLAEAFEAGRKEGQPKWIPCSERMPKEEDEIYSRWCLVWVSFEKYERVEIDFYDYVENEWFNYGDRVILWMPLPKQPKGGEQ